MSTTNRLVAALRSAGLHPDRAELEEDGDGFDVVLSFPDDSARPILYQITSRLNVSEFYWLVDPGVPGFELHTPAKNIPALTAAVKAYDGRSPEPGSREAIIALIERLEAIEHDGLQLRPQDKADILQLEDWQVTPPKDWPTRSKRIPPAVAERREETAEQREQKRQLLIDVTEGLVLRERLELTVDAALKEQEFWALRLAGESLAVIGARLKLSWAEMAAIIKAAEE